MTEIQALCDEIVEDLRALREASGSPSFGELVARISRSRVERGLSPAQARVGRTTVYDVFRPGRRFLDPDLVGEVAAALGASEDTAALWAERARQARTGTAITVMDPEPAAARIELTEGKNLRPVMPMNLRLLLFVGCLALNLVDRWLVNKTGIPLYLDMVGTAIVAIVIGPWSGAAVGVLTSVLGAYVSGWNSVPFALVEVAGALLWGYGVRRWRMGRTIPRFFLLNIIVALASSCIAVPIIVWLDGGFTGNGADRITHAYDAVMHSLVAAVSSQNLLTSLADKMISGFVALAAAEAIPSSYLEGRDRWKITSAWLLGVSWMRTAARV